MQIKEPAAPPTGSRYFGVSLSPIQRHNTPRKWGCQVQIWADASFNNWTKEAGLGILIREIIPNGVKETKLSIKTKAADNNQAELLAIYHALQHIKGVSREEPIFIITDSQIAIDCIKHPENKCDKFREVAERIRGMLYCEKWRIYHKKAHTRNKDRYSVRQAITDKLANKARLTR